MGNLCPKLKSYESFEEEAVEENFSNSSATNNDIPVTQEIRRSVVRQSDNAVVVVEENAVIHEPVVVEKNESNSSTREDTVQVSNLEPSKETSLVRVEEEDISAKVEKTLVIKEDVAVTTIKAVEPSSVQRKKVVKEIIKPKLSDADQRIQRLHSFVASKGIHSQDSTIQFPFFWNPDAIQFILQSNVMFILRGPSGSGKSFLTHMLRTVYEPQIVECSADQYFIQRDGTYNFDSSLLKQAHETSQRRAFDACQRSVPVVIVDNTNIRRWEMKNYVETAKKFNYFVIIVQPKTDWRTNPEALAARNSHGVSLDIIQSKIKLFEEYVPFYYGWFLNRKDSLSLMELVRRLMEEAFNTNSHFRSLLQGYLGERQTLLKYYGLDSTEDEKMLHCTAKFLGSHKQPALNRREYLRRSDVQDSVGSCSSLGVHAIVITPRTVGARVRLSPEQLRLYDKPEETAEVDEQVAQCLTKGCAAHLTMSRVKGVAAMKTNLDILSVLERQVYHQLNGTFCQRVKLQSLHELEIFDNGIFQINLHQDYHFPCIFGGFY